MKKIITFALIALVAATAFTACTKGDAVVTISAAQEMTVPRAEVVFDFSVPTTASETVLQYEILSDKDVIIGQYKNVLKVPMGYDRTRLSVLLKHDSMPGEYNVTFRITSISAGYKIGNPSKVTTKIIIPESHVK